MLISVVLPIFVLFIEVLRHLEVIENHSNKQIEKNERLCDDVDDQKHDDAWSMGWCYFLVVLKPILESDKSEHGKERLPQAAEFIWQSVPIEVTSNECKGVQYKK